MVSSPRSLETRVAQASSLARPSRRTRRPNGRSSRTRPATTLAPSTTAQSRRAGERARSSAVLWRRVRVLLEGGSSCRRSRRKGRRTSHSARLETSVPCAYSRGRFCADTLGIASFQVCSAMLNNAVDASCLATPGGVTTISENQVRHTLPISQALATEQSFHSALICSAETESSSLERIATQEERTRPAVIPTVRPAPRAFSSRPLMADPSCTNPHSQPASSATVLSAIRPVRPAASTRAPSAPQASSADPAWASATLPRRALVPARTVRRTRRSTMVSLLSGRCAW